MNRAFIFSILILLLFSCGSLEKHSKLNHPKEQQSFMYSQFELQVGDILFQDSDCGAFCTSIEKVTEGIKGAKFSHVGMVMPGSTGEFVVIEAISNGVVQTPLDSFFVRSFDAEKNSKVVVGRVKESYRHLIPAAIDFAQSKLAYPYDDVFDINNEKYYCSELIYDAFKAANQERPIFQLQKMTFVDPDTKQVFPVWKDYFDQLNVPIPEGEPGLNPGGMSKSRYIDIVHFYGKPQGYIE